jgi:hypothetical protein
MTHRSAVEFWADWIVDAVAAATQDRRFLRGDEHVPDPTEEQIASGTDENRR